MPAEGTRQEERAGHVERAPVLAELDRILGSVVFRNARRSRELLEYIVNHALDGQPEDLRERTIGARVFQRNLDYNTGDDSIVRVRASELRRRLAQYYSEEGSAHGLRIDLPPGSYVPEFRHITPAAAPPVDHALPAVEPAARTPATAKPGWRPFAVAPVLVMCLLGAACLVWVVWPRLADHRTTELDRFWQPVFGSSRPLILCVAHPLIFRVTGESRNTLAQAFDNSLLPETIPTRDIARDAGHYVGYGDAFALAEMTRFFSLRGKKLSLRIGDDMSFAELRNSPAVLIGSFTNQWTMQMMRGLRFSFVWDATGPAIQDQKKPSVVWRRPVDKRTQDFVLVTRILDSRTGETLITAAGLAHEGTQMAGELLTNPSYFARALSSAPKDWTRRNIQLVLTGEVIGKTVGPPRLIASAYW